MNVNGWVNGLAFSPSANLLSYVTHDCEVNFVDISKLGTAEGQKIKPETEKIMHNGNPHLHCIFVDDSTLVASGYDKVPYVYKKEVNWSMKTMLDPGMKNFRKAKISGNSFVDKKVYFNPDIKLGANVELKETDTMHSNYVNCLKPFAQSSGKPLILCSSDVNGHINYWDVQKV